MLTPEERPQWVKEKSECLFCRAFSDCSSIEVRGDDVAVKYACENTDCYHRRLAKGTYGQYVMTLIYQGFAESYEDFLTKPKEPGLTSSLAPEVET